MTITQFGRVEFDPMRVPVSTRTATKDIPSFDEQFQSEVIQGQRFKPAPANEVDEKAKKVTPSQSAPTEPETKSSPVQQGEDTPESVEAPVADSTAKSLPREGQEPQQETISHGGASVRRTNAGKGVEAPSIFSKDGGDTAEPKVLRNQANGSELLSQIAITNSAQQGQTSTAPTTIRSDALAIKDIGAKSRTHVNSPFAGYKTTNKYSLQFAEAARESVFKQIAIRLKADGGDMMLRLNPPELGKLDLRMRIENHNQMRLVISAERPELVALLEKHMAELEQELQRQGITITGTEIRQSGQEGASEAQNDFRQSFADDPEGTANQEDETLNQLDKIRPGTGFITADSLDFWA